MVLPSGSWLLFGDHRFRSPHVFTFTAAHIHAQFAWDVAQRNRLILSRLTWDSRFSRHLNKRNFVYQVVIFCANFMSVSVYFVRYVIVAMYTSLELPALSSTNWPIYGIVLGVAFWSHLRFWLGNFQKYLQLCPQQSKQDIHVASLFGGAFHCYTCFELHQRHISVLLITGVMMSRRVY